MGFLSSTLYLLVWCSKGVTEWTVLCLWVYSWGLTATPGGSDHRSRSARRTVEEAHGRSCTRCTVPRWNHAARTRTLASKERRRPFRIQKLQREFKLLDCVLIRRTTQLLRFEVPSSWTEVACSFAVVLVHPPPRFLSVSVPLCQISSGLLKEMLTKEPSSTFLSELSDHFVVLFLPYLDTFFIFSLFSSILNTLPNSYALCAQLLFVHDL